jgi:hypothetical protein
MTSVLVFIKPGTPGQLSVGAMITFSFLILALNYRPFCTSTLNSLNSMTLIAQFCTLFVGIMIALLDASPAQEGADDRFDRAIMTVMVMLINGATMVWPFLRKILSGTLSGYFELFVGFYQGCCSLYVRWCGRRDQSASIAASMTAGVNTGASTESSIAADLVLSASKTKSMHPGILAAVDLEESHDLLFPDLEEAGPESEDAIELQCCVEDLIQQPILPGTPPPRRLRMIRGTDHDFEMARAGGGGGDMDRRRVVVTREGIEEHHEIEILAV